MTTLKPIALTCPVCENRFGSSAVLGRGSAWRKRTDFQEPTAGRTTLPFLVHMCPRCGFAAAAEDFEEPRTDGSLRDRVRSELTPRLGGRPLSGSEKLEFAAKVALWQGEGMRRVAELWLYAAWCCVDEGDTEAERYFQRFVARAYEDALASYDGVDVDDRAVITYLVGELWRRIGDAATAQAWFDAVPAEITKPSGQEWILAGARAQRDAPKEWFD